MRRDKLTADQLDSAIGHAWSVAWCGSSENDDGSHGGHVDLDLFCHFRLTDGKVWFVTVACPDAATLAKIVATVNRGSDALNLVVKADAAKLTLKPPGSEPCPP